MPTDADGVPAPLFAFEEIAWLREAAIAIAQREGADRDGIVPRDVRDVHCAPSPASASSRRIRGCSRRFANAPAGR